MLHVIHQSWKFIEQIFLSGDGERDDRVDSLSFGFGFVNDESKSAVVDLTYHVLCLSLRTMEQECVIRERPNSLIERQTQ